MNDAQHPLNALPQGYRLYEYELLRVLGFGGFGMTYLSFDHNLDKAFAIKEYLPSDIATRTGDNSVAPQASHFRDDFEWGLDRFLDEARILARFDHRHIVHVHRFFEAHGTAYIVMEYAEGETLSAFLARKWTLNESELKAILYPILDGLQEVHRADFLHRDIKPGNIIIRDEDNSPVLLDFGAARQAMGSKSHSITSIITPGYAPIEQYSSRGDQGPWTDIYALGGVCYQALTGRVPDDATDRIRDDPLVPIEQLCSGQVSEPMLNAIDWALQVNESDRPQSIAGWLTVMDEETPSATTPPEDHHVQSPHEEVQSTPELTPIQSRADDANRLNRWFLWFWISLLAIILLPFLPASISPFDEFSFIVSGSLGIISLVCGCCILHKLWSLIPTGEAKITPGKAVGFLFIPFFNLYWSFIAIYGLAQALNSQTRQRLITNKNVSEVLSLIFCIFFTIKLLVIWLIVLTTWLPDVREVLRFQEDLVLGLTIITTAATNIVLSIILFKQMTNAGIALLNEAAQVEPAIPSKKPKSKVLWGILCLCLLLTGLGGYWWWEDKKHQTEIVQWYVEEFESALQSKDFGLASGYVDSIRVVDADSPVLLELEGRLSAARHTEEIAFRVSGLLSGATEDMASDRLTRPAGNNAWEKYQSVLKLEPGHEIATAGLDSIIARYVMKFESVLRSGNLDIAGNYVARIKEVYADAPVLPELEGRLSAARQAEHHREAERAKRSAEEAEKRRQEQVVERAKRSAEEAEKRRQEQVVGRIFKDCVECPQMVVVPSGSFTMGSPNTEDGREDNEGPQNVVRIDYRFAVGVYEVTFAEWDACVADGGCMRYRPNDEGWGRGNRPAINVSWGDAQSYAGWLSGKTGHKYGLLSEAEWEYAARAGSVTAYSWGDDIGDNRANCDGCGSQWDVAQTAPVGSFEANVWGLHDMHGNVYEWVQDCWNDNYEGAPADGTARLSGDCDRRVLRGGSWNYSPQILRSASRVGLRSDYGSLSRGFRVVRRF